MYVCTNDDPISDSVFCVYEFSHTNGKEITGRLAESGLLRLFAKQCGVTPTEVQILYLPPCHCRGFETEKEFMRGKRDLKERYLRQ